MVEIMVVIVIIGILAALAVPKFNTYTGESQLDGDAQSLFLDMQLLRSQALLTRQRHVLTFSTVAADGGTRLGWQISQVNADGTLTPVKSSHAGVTVELGLPAGLAAPTSAQFSGMFATIGTTVTGGLGTGVAAAIQCMGTSDASETWVGGISACGGATSDMETGVLYLHSSRSDERAYAIAFNRNVDLGLKRFRYMGGSWSTF